MLVLKDDFSSYVHLKCEAADAENISRALMNLFASFGVVIQWVSDRGTHFKDEVVECIREYNMASHAVELQGQTRCFSQYPA